MSVIACIGAQETPKAVLEWMERLGAAIIRAGHEVRSGNGPGADQAWARGASSEDAWKVTICLPWRAFNRQAVAHGNVVIGLYDLGAFEAAEYRALAAETHPRFGFLNARAQKLHTRNALIIRGADRVLGYLNHNKLGCGGTGSTFRMAVRQGLPTQDVSKSEVRTTLEKEFGL